VGKKFFKVDPLENVLFITSDCRVDFASDFEKQLFEKLWGYFAPMRKRREEILKDKSYIDDVLARGAKRANEIADQVMQRVRAAVGIR
jgi:tryptophanyl-tRNA synthetase